MAARRPISTSLTWRTAVAVDKTRRLAVSGYLTNTKVRGQLKKTRNVRRHQRKPGVAERRNAAERLSRWCDESGAC